MLNVSVCVAFILAGINLKFFFSGAVLRTLKRLKFNEKFDYDLIYPSNDNAVYSILSRPGNENYLVTRNNSMLLDFESERRESNSNNSLNNIHTSVDIEKAAADSYKSNSKKATTDCNLSAAHKTSEDPESNDEISYPSSLYKRKMESDLDEIIY